MGEKNRCPRGEQGKKKNRKKEKKMREEKRRETREDLLPKIAKAVEQDSILGALENSFQRKNRRSKGGRSSMKKAHLW